MDDTPRLGHITVMQESCQLKPDGRRQKTKYKKHRKQSKKATQSEIGTIIALRAQGLEAREIAQEIGKPETQVLNAMQQISWIQNLTKDMSVLKEYRERQVDLLEILQSEIIRQLLTKLQNGEGTLRELTYCFKELFTASRLIQGKVTQLTGELRFTAPPELAQALTERLSCIDITNIDNNGDKDSDGVPFD